MAKAPGILYLWSLVPFFTIPPTLIYAVVKLAESQSGFVLPSWVKVLAVLSAPLVLSVLQPKYNRLKERRDAAANNAFVVPTVREKTGFAVMKALRADMQTGYPGQFFKTYMEKYGYVYQLRFPSDSRVITMEPDHIKAILATQFDTFQKGPILFKQFHSLLGTGVFNADGDMWKFHRSMARPYFTKDRISHFDNFDLHCSDALKQATSRLSEGYAFDFQDLVSRFTLDSGTQFLFGYDVQSLSAGLSYPESSSHLNTSTFLEHPSNTFVEAFVEGQQRTARRTRLGPLWPLAELGKDEIEPFRKVVNGYIEPFLIEALKKQEATKDEVKEDVDLGDSLLDHLVHHTQDFDILKDELVNLLVAGRDTTACTLTYAFYMLAEHPEIAARLRKEVLETVGATNRPSYDDIRSMKYLRAFLNEVLRLYPPVPFNNRTSDKPAVWTSKTPGSKPYFVPANTRILYSVMLMQRRTDLWGPDALEFDPDRFLDDRLHKYLTPNPYIFLPFNAGPRICLGQQFAYQEASFFLIRLLQRFTNFRLAPDAQPKSAIPPAHWAHAGEIEAKEKIMPALTLTLFVKGGLWVKMDPVEAEAN